MHFPTESFPLDLLFTHHCNLPPLKHCWWSHFHHVSQVKCKMCNKKMERRHLLDHEVNISSDTYSSWWAPGVFFTYSFVLSVFQKDECSERPQICEFCQLELPLSNLKEHRVSCGSRTELCSDCGRYVKLMDQLDHAQICSTSTPTTSKDLVSEDDASDTDG